MKININPLRITHMVNRTAQARFANPGRFEGPNTATLIRSVDDYVFTSSHQSYRLPDSMVDSLVGKKDLLPYLHLVFGSLNTLNEREGAVDDAIEFVEQIATTGVYTYDKLRNSTALSTRFCMEIESRFPPVNPWQRIPGSILPELYREVDRSEISSYVWEQASNRLSRPDPVEYGLYSLEQSMSRQYPSSDCFGFIFGSFWADPRGDAIPLSFAYDEISSPQRGDIVLYYNCMLNEIMHVGIMYDDRLAVSKFGSLDVFLHAYYNTLSDYGEPCFYRIK